MKGLYWIGKRLDLNRCAEHCFRFYEYSFVIPLPSAAALLEYLFRFFLLSSVIGVSDFLMALPFRIYVLLLSVAGISDLEIHCLICEDLFIYILVHQYTPLNCYITTLQAQAWKK
jgi:hypothetical protein